MGFRIIGPGGKQIELIKGTPEKTPALSLPGNTENLYATGSFGSIYFQHLASEGFDAWLTHYEIVSPPTFTIFLDEPLIFLHIQLENEITVHHEGKEPFVVGMNQYIFSHSAPLRISVSLYPAKKYQAFYMLFKKSFLQYYVHAFPLLTEFFERIENGIEADLHKEKDILPRSAVILIHDLLRKDLPKPIAPLYIECKLRELLLLIFVQLSAPDKKNPVSFSNADLSKTGEAKNIMLADLSKKYTVKDLAKKAGMNYWKLHACFKQQFGVTIYRFLLAARLEHAKFLLLHEKDYTLQDIAELCGYRDHSNFTAAFKRECGYAPGEWRKNKMG
jgi:AraC family transcriptional regulator, transcriptional activator of the genes for pyochelin and ferripyochelin receptors